MGGSNGQAGASPALLATVLKIEKKNPRAAGAFFFTGAFSRSRIH
jgi:hypothetical protein